MVLSEEVRWNTAYTTVLEMYPSCLAHVLCHLAACLSSSFTVPSSLVILQLTWVCCWFLHTPRGLRTWYLLSLLSGRLLLQIFMTRFPGANLPPKQCLTLFKIIPFLCFASQIQMSCCSTVWREIFYYDDQCTPS